ncbi:uncharacterized protein LOC143571954 [Bidens hawaiensis]|uniref:uncharacterized protein LOC143571954 n=1 Tax=Bidens hawaiensis TaxID=980011 RepID=UPI00404A3B5F
MEEQKHISCDSRLARYQSFIVQNLESHNQCCESVDGRRIRACFHGWVILSNRNSDNSVIWSLWNPITSKFICLPPLIINDNKTNYSYECCLSSSSDDEQGSVFLLFSPHMPTFVFCLLDRERKSLTWTEMSYEGQLNGVEYFHLGRPACCNGKVYALAIDEWDCQFVVQVDIMVQGKEVVISLLPFVELPDTSTYRLHYESCFLKGSCIELFYIKVSHKENNDMVIDEVRLFKLDMNSMMWKEIRDLKDAIFNIKLSAVDGSYCVFYKPTVTSKIGGCAYIFNKIGRVISFHAKDRTMSLPSVPCLVQEGRLVVWAMLECGLEANHHDFKQEEQRYKDNLIIAVPANAEFDRTSESQLLNIPFHVLEMIMECCVGVEYMKFHATCSRCRFAATSIQWNNKTTLRRWQMHTLVSPWLMVLDNHRHMTFIDPICRDKYFIKTPQELHDDYEIYCSKYGWLLMCKDDGPVVFFNPFAGDIRKLHSSGYYFQSLCFSAPPTSPDCMVAGFTRRHDNGVHICIYFVSQEATWRGYHLFEVTYDPYTFNFLTFSGRDMYFLCDNQRIDIFRGLGDEKCSRVVVNDVPRSCCVSPREYFLSICDQHLLLVIVGKFVESVEVFKLNVSTKDWEKIDDLGKHMIYISQASCICLEAKTSEMENKIYFPRVLDDDDTKLVFYSLETCSYHTFDDKNIQESFDLNMILKVNQHHGPHTWIEPSWS